jgi:Tfp pilus assembly protein PilV
MTGSKRGITLIEVLLAVFILMVAGGGILSSYLSSHQLSEHATDTMIAVKDLEDLLERIHATPFTNLTAAFPNGVVNGPANSYPGIVGGYALANEQITVTYTSQTAGRIEMLATVTWLSRGRPRTASLATVRTSG